MQNAHSGSPEPPERPPGVLGAPFARRGFLALAGISAVALVTGCGDDEDMGAEGSGQTGATTGAGTMTMETKPGAADTVVLDFSTDVGVVNYAYALEQLEAAFYTQVNDNMFSGASRGDREVLEALENHEVAHREFFKAKLGNMAIGALTPDFSMVDFRDRASVLGTALTFENLGVWAYNGAGRLIDGGGPLGIMPLLAAGEIVSVEARHAAAVYDLVIVEGGDPAFKVEAFDMALAPPEVLSQVDPFVMTNVRIENLSTMSNGGGG